MEQEVSQEQDKKPNPYWLKINKLEEEIKILKRKLEVIEMSLRRGK